MTTTLRFRTNAIKDPSVAGARNVKLTVYCDVEPGEWDSGSALGTLYMTPEECEAFTARLFSDSVRPSGPTLPTRADLDPDHDPITPLTDLEPRHGQAAH